MLLFHSGVAPLRGENSIPVLMTTNCPAWAARGCGRRAAGGIFMYRTIRLEPFAGSIVLGMPCLVLGSLFAGGSSVGKVLVLTNYHIGNILGNEVWAEYRQVDSQFVAIMVGGQRSINSLLLTGTGNSRGKVKDFSGLITAASSDRIMQ